LLLGKGAAFAAFSGGTLGDNHLFEAYECTFKD